MFHLCPFTHPIQVKPNASKIIDVTVSEELVNTQILEVKIKANKIKTRSHYCLFIFIKIKFQIFIIFSTKNIFATINKTNIIPMNPFHSLMIMSKSLSAFRMHNLKKLSAKTNSIFY